MKTTFKQFMTEMQSAESKDDLIASIDKNGRFTKDMSTQVFYANFYCDRRQLASLIGVPKTIARTFNCEHNLLTSLTGAPEFVGESFECEYNKLKTLKGAPGTCNADFLCSDNKLTSLEGAPRHVVRDLKCLRNNLVSLEGAPSYIGGNLLCEDNDLTSLHDVHKHVPYIAGALDLTGNRIRSHILGLLKIKKLQQVFFDDKKLQEIINKHLPEGDIFKCQQELIDSGYEKCAQL